MRILLAAFLIFVASCAPIGHTPAKEEFIPMAGERIDLFYGDIGSDTLINISVDRLGNSRFDIKWDGRHKIGTFIVGQNRLAELKQRLLPYWLQAVPTSQRGGRSPNCTGEYRPGHTGAIVIRWVEPGIDSELYISRNCDAEKFKARNDALVGMIQDVAGALMEHHN